MIQITERERVIVDKYFICVSHIDLSEERSLHRVPDTILPVIRDQIFTAKESEKIILVIADDEKVVGQLIDPVSPAQSVKTCRVDT